MALDERLRRDLERIAPPADPSGVYEELIRRRERRRIASRLRRASLGFVAVAMSLVLFVALTRLFGEPGRPSTSPLPLGGRIAFVTFQYSGDGIGSKVFLANTDGSGRVSLFEVSEPVERLQWSRDGTELAVGTGSALWIVDIVSGDKQEVDLGGGSAYGFSWSPDGSRFVAADDHSGLDTIYVMDRDGTHRSALIQGNSFGWTSWSPDGQQILFVGPGPTGARQAWDIYVMNADGSGVRNLTDSDTVDLEPSWSPDGSSILFRSRRDPPPGWNGGDAPDEIYVMRPDGNDVARLTIDTAIDQRPVWSPDGTRIAFTSWEQGDRSRVYSIRVDGTDRTELLPNEDVALIAWQPVAAVGPTGPSGDTTPTVAPDPGNDGDVVDLGLDFPVCDVTSVAGRFGLDAVGSAYVVTRAEDGCPRLGTGEQRLGVDLTDDGTIDTVSEPLECDDWCTVFAAPDVDDDGTDEVLVQNIQFSIAGLRLFDLVVDLPGGDVPSIVAVTVADPGYPGEGLEPGTQPQLWIGGDAFATETLRCATSTSGRVLIQTSATMDPPDDPEAVWLAHETTFALNPDGTLSIVDVRTFNEPIDGDFSFAQGDGVCGARTPSRFSGGG